MPNVPVIAERVSDIRVGPSASQGTSFRDLDYTFDVENTTGKSPNKAQVTIYNLSDASKAKLEKPNQLLQIIAGEGTAGQLFLGDISRKEVKHSYQPPNWQTEIKAADGRRLFRESRFIQSYPARTPRSLILSDVISTMGAKRGFIDPSIPERVYPAALNFARPCRKVLSWLLAPDGATWSLQSGAVQILAAGTPKRGQSLLISADTGMVGSPTKTSKGVEFEMLLSPSVQPGAVVVFDARKLKGGYKITKAKHSGSRVGQPWRTKGLAVEY